MNKLRLYALLASSITVCTVTFFSANKFMAAKQTLLLSNIEALAKNELPAGWIQGKKMTELKFPTGGNCSAGCTFGVGSDGKLTCSIHASIGTNYKNIHCCTDSEDMNACDPSGNYTECKYTTL